MTPGRFIVFEGVEGSGKTTQAAMLAQWLSQAGIPHRLTREPGGTDVAEQIRSVILHGDDIAIETELLLVLAARAAHVRELIQPSLETGFTVVCDRFELSTLAYQGAGRELGLERVRVLNDFATGGLHPDLTIVIDVPMAVGEARRARSRPSSDRIERAGDAFHTRVAEAYRLLASEEDAVELLDGTAAPAFVHEAVIGLLRARFSETFPSITG
jgi:dTMP kinase